MNRSFAVLAVAGVLVLACRDGLAPGGGDTTIQVPANPGAQASPQTATAVLAALDQSGWSAMDFGAVGATSEYQNDGEAWGASPFGVAAAVVPVPEFWGRLRGDPVRRTREVTEQGDTAWASIRVDYNGAFLLDLTPGDGRLSVTSKPLVESMVQQARFERSAANERGQKHWVLVAITPQQYLATEATRRTVKITELTVSVNGVVKINVTDPAVLARITQGGTADHRAVPLFNRGDTVKVAVKVANTTGTDHTPPTFAFLSSFHADPNGLGWRRMRMPGTSTGSFELGWVAQQKGRERFIVEALDAQSFVSPTADDYRANIWGVPYQIQ